MSLEARVNLITATLDLQLVRLLRGAIRTADIASGVRRDIAPQPTIEPRQHFHPEPIIEPRRHIHPQPKLDPRSILRALPACPPPSCQPCPIPSEPAPDPVTRCKHPNAILPPWKQPIWNTPIPPRPIVKLLIHRTDIINKGSLIDLFL
ncbi:MAG TPA: hypothetical protein VIL86_18250 [Tepidisphaeraceae bacterium]